MNKKDIIALPNEHLRHRSKKVGLITPEIRKLVEDMQNATLDWEASRKHEVGVALAAIQVDRPLRIVIIRNNFDNKEDKTFAVFINPVITKYEGKIEQDFEGCLSVPDNGAVFIDHIKDDPLAFFRLDEKGRLEQLDYETDVRDNRILW